MSFGYIDGGVATVFETLRAVEGSQGTIAAPAYTLSRGTTYDVRMSPSQGARIPPEYIPQLPGVIRSACSMHYHVGLGAKAHVLKELDGGVSIGPSSDFEALLTANFRLLLLDAGLAEGAAFIHHIETLAQVPYCSWLAMPRESIGADGATQVMTCRFYGRQQHFLGAENFDVHFDTRRETGIYAQDRPINRYPYPASVGPFPLLFGGAPPTAARSTSSKSAAAPATTSGSLPERVSQHMASRVRPRRSPTPAIV